MRHSKLTIFKLWLIPFLTVGLALLIGGRVNAATSIGSTQPSDGTYMAIGGVGSQFDSPESISRLYVPDGSSSDLTIWAWNGWDVDDMVVTTTNGSNNCNDPSNPANVVGSTSVPNILGGATATINGIGAATNSHDGYKVYCVYLSSSTVGVTYFTLSASNGLVGNDISGTPAARTGFVHDLNPRDTDPAWTKRLDFAPLCVGAAGSLVPGVIQFYDLDLNSAFQGSMNITIYETASDGADLPSPADSTSGMNVFATETFVDSAEHENRNMPLSGTLNYRVGRKYRMIMTPIGDSNAFKVSLPFEEFNAARPCNPNPNPPGGNISITCDVNSSVLSISANVSDPDSGDTLSVSVDVTGIGNLTGSRVGNGTINLGTRQGSPGGGYTASGTVSDGAHTSWLSGASVTCNRPPAGQLFISCNPDTAVLTINANVQDGDGGSLSVSANISGASPGSASGSRVNSGPVALNPGTVQGQFGWTHTISGTVTDAAGATRGMTADATSCPPLVWITGRLKNAYTPTYDDYSGVTIQTCRPAGVPASPQTATTDANGYFAFRVPASRIFCVRIDPTTLSANATRQARPQYEDYQGCGPFNASSPTPAPGYCSAYNSYENQFASAGDGSGVDRATNDGFDFALRFPPRITCRFEPAITGIIGVGTTVNPKVRVTNISTVYEASPATGSVTFRFEGRADETDNYGDDYPLPRGISTDDDSSNTVADDARFTSFTVNVEGDYTVSATGIASGDGLTSAPVNCDGGGEANVGLFPYLREFGGDVAVGGNFLPGTCSPSTELPGNIFAYNSLRGSGSDEHYVGSSAQFTVQALLNINGFASESMRNKNVATVTGRPAKGMSFSNTAGNSTYGGAYGAGQCITDYYASTIATPEDTDISTSSTNFPVVGPATPEPIYADAPTQRAFVPATSAAGTDVAVNAGTQYRITVYGTYSYAGAGARVADARCNRDSPSAQWSAGPPSITILSLRINGQIIPWGTDGATPMPGTTDPTICTSNNSYVYTFTPTTSNLHFEITDSNYTDNTGGISVAVAPVMSVTASSTSPPSPDLKPEDVVDGIRNQWNWGEWASNCQLRSAALLATNPCPGATPGDPWVQLDLGNSRTVGRVNIYDRINPYDHMTSGFVTLYNAAGTALATQTFGSLGNTTGAALPVNFPTPVGSVRRVRVTLTSAAPSTYNAGLAEVEVPVITGYQPITSSAPPGRHQFHYSGSRTIGDGNDILIPSGAQTAIFVNDGDLYIRSNIRLADNYTGIANMPYFAMIVKGNIYIDKDVTRLDGLFVAQPRTDGTGGTIYTCGRDNGTSYVHYGPNASSGLDIYSQCNKQLSINGSVVAKRIKWLRILENISVSRPGDATFGEAYSPETGAGTNASEVVNYTPQMWLAPSPLKLPGSTTDGVSDPTSPANTEPYQYIRALPPIL